VALESDDGASSLGTDEVVTAMHKDKVPDDIEVSLAHRTKILLKAASSVQRRQPSDTEEITQGTKKKAKATERRANSVQITEREKPSKKHGKRERHSGEEGATDIEIQPAPIRAGSVRSRQTHEEDDPLQPAPKKKRKINIFSKPSEPAAFNFMPQVCLEHYKKGGGLT
jgi:hypothetical protein